MPNNDMQSQFTIPDDFPRPQHVGAIGGAQPKFLLVQYERRFYTLGCTPPELFRRWNKCEDLSQQLVVKSRESKAGKRAHMSEIEILEQYYERILKTGWGSDEEMRWLIRRTAEVLGWPAPAAAAFSGTYR